MSSDVELNAKLSSEDLDDLARLTRSRWHLLRFLLAHWYGLALASIVPLVTIDALWHWKTANWWGLAIAWAVFGVFWWCAWDSAQLERKRELRETNADRPDSVRIGPSGLAFADQDGASGRLPWSQFKGWREGRRIVLLDRHDDRSSLALSIATLADSERERLRALLKHHVASRSRDI